MDFERIEREKKWHSEYVHYGKFSDKFGSIYNDLILKKFDEEIIDHLKPESTVFLDYGCGGENFLIENAANMRLGYGIDITDVLIERLNNLLKNKNIQNIQFAVMYAMSTTFESNQFDIIRGKAILHHLDLKLSLEEIKRIIKKDGIAYFIEPLDTNFLIKLYRKMTPKLRTIDEQPLRRKDIKLIKTLFPETEIRYHLFFTLLAFPFLKCKIYNILLRVLYNIDLVILNKYSPLKWMGWICTIKIKS